MGNLACSGLDPGPSPLLQQRTPGWSPYVYTPDNPIPTMVENLPEALACECLLARRTSDRPGSCRQVNTAIVTKGQATFDPIPQFLTFVII